VNVIGIQSCQEADHSLGENAEECPSLRFSTDVGADVATGTLKRLEEIAVFDPETSLLMPGVNQGTLD
jgi:hypothetical protein